MCRVLGLVAQSCLTLCNLMDCSPPGSSVHGDSPMARILECYALLQRIFPTQGSSQGLPNCRWILYPLSHEGSPHTTCILDNSLVKTTQITFFFLGIWYKIFMVNITNPFALNFRFNCRVLMERAGSVYGASLKFQWPQLQTAKVLHIVVIVSELRIHRPIFPGLVGK